MNGEKKGPKPQEPIPFRKLMETKVKDIMNRRPRTVHPDTSIGGLLERLLGQIERCFPVVDKDEKLVGLVSLRDIIELYRVLR